MSKVKLRFLATLATVIGRKEVETEASTLKEALDALTAEYTRTLRQPESYCECS